MTLFLQIFWAFLQIGLFSIGGGYAAMPLIEAQAVDRYAWITAEEFSTLVTIAEMTPGPIAVNAATFVGTRVAGFLGAVVATMGCILPSCLIVSLLAILYRRFGRMPIIQKVLGSLRPIVVSLIASAGLSILITVLFPDGAIAIDKVNLLGAALFVGAFFALRRLKWNPILTMLLCGGINLAVSLISSLVMG
jgi:chromate transporter